jgi:hypothetical protein
LAFSGLRDFVHKIALALIKRTGEFGPVRSFAAKNAESAKAQFHVASSVPGHAFLAFFAVK